MFFWPKFFDVSDLNGSIFLTSLASNETMVEYQSLADRLLRDGFLLTALEFQTELVERGKSLKSLQKFFEDSSNFETYTRKLEKSPAPSVSSVAGSQVVMPLDPF